MAATIPKKRFLTVFLYLQLPVKSLGKDADICSILLRKPTLNTVIIIPKSPEPSLLAEMLLNNSTVRIKSTQKLKNFTEEFDVTENIADSTGDAARQTVAKGVR